MTLFAELSSKEGWDRVATEGKLTFAIFLMCFIFKLFFGIEILCNMF
jgi:hypothetical protein